MEQQFASGYKMALQWNLSIYGHPRDHTEVIYHTSLCIAVSLILWSLIERFHCNS